MINDRARNYLDCNLALHPKMSCTQYKMFKTRRMFIVAVKLQMIATLLPGILGNMKKLKTDFWPTMKKILIKYARSVAFITFIGAVPAIAMCHVQKLTGQPNRLMAIICFCIGYLGLWLEPVEKHSTYFGYFAPKAIEILFNVFEERGYYKSSQLRELVVLFIASGALGLAASRGHGKPAQKLGDKKVEEEDEVKFTGPLGMAWN